MMPQVRSLMLYLGKRMMLRALCCCHGDCVGTYGMPMALYHDGHGIFECPKSQAESLEEQPDGKRKPTQFGRLIEELGITSIS